MIFDYSAQPKETVMSCNLCGSNGGPNGAIIAERGGPDRYGIPLLMAKCQWCGLEFLNPRMTKDAYREFYANGTYRELLSEFYGEPVTAESIEPQQQIYAGKVSLLMAPFFKARKVETLLDVGGSTGVVSERMAKDHELDCTVLEPSVVEGKDAMDRGFTVLQGVIEDLEPLCDLFDVVLLCQTVDHLTDISGSLRTIRAMLADDGLFFVDIVENGPVKVDHPYYLSRTTMADYLRRTGFRVVFSGADGDDLHYNFVATRA